MAKPHDLINAIAAHQGRANGISARRLAEQLQVSPRSLRRLISEVRDEGLPICGRPSTGYFLASNKAELQECCAFLEARALHSLHLLARMRRVSLPALCGQLNLNQA
jgi:predicted DNA-binding transcriptional regulator YafY